MDKNASPIPPAALSSGVAVRRVTTVVRRRLLLIVGITTVLGLVAFGYSATQTKMYTASSTLLFRDSTLDQTLFGGTFVKPYSDPDREASTNEQLVGAPIVAQRTAAALGPPWTSSTVASAVTIAAQGQSSLVSVSATTPSRLTAYRVARQYALQFIATRRLAARARTASARHLIQQQLAELPATASPADRRELQSRADQLTVITALQTGGVELVAEAPRLPTDPSSPKVVRNTLIGLFVGLLLGLGAAFAAERINRRLHDLDELEAAFGLPVLGVLPRTRELADARLGNELSQGAAEAFRLIRARLRFFNIDKRMEVILVTSAAPGEGKSTVAANLARVMAAMATRTGAVLLLETDLRRPTVARDSPALVATPGLSEVLAGYVELGDVIQEVTVSTDPGNSDLTDRRLDVITAGTIPPNPSALIESTRFDELLHSLTGSYDTIIVDAAPATIVSEVLHLASVADGVILVSRPGVTTRESARVLVSQLDGPSVNLLGLVVNGVKTGVTGYHDGYNAYGGYAAYGGSHPYSSTDTEVSRGMRSPEA